MIENEEQTDILLSTACLYLLLAQECKRLKVSCSYLRWEELSFILF